MTKARTIVVSNACDQLSAINVQTFEVAQALSVKNLFLDHHVFEEFKDHTRRRKKDKIMAGKNWANLLTAIVESLLWLLLLPLTRGLRATTR